MLQPSHRGALGRGLVLTILTATLASACASGGIPYDPDDPRLDRARLEIIGDATFNLMYGERTSLRVRYVFESGEVITGAPIDWVQRGGVGSSTISAGETTTGDDGTTEITVTAGSVNEDFTVEAIPGAGSSVTFRVGVTEDPAGSISISMSYRGEQRLEDFTPWLFRGVSCDGLNPLRLPPMAERIGAPVLSLTDRPGFTGVAPANDYTVVVVANVSRTPAAWGCRVGVEVFQGEETFVPIDLVDLESSLRFEGTYDLGNVFDFGGALPESAEVALDVLGEIADDSSIGGNPATMDWGQDPGAFFTDIIMRLTCAWDCSTRGNYSACGGFTSDAHGWGDLQALYEENFTSWDGAQSRFFGGCAGWEIGARAAQEWINLQVGRYVPTIVIRFLEAASDLANAIVNARIQSVLMLAQADEFGAIPFDHRLLIMEVSLRDLGGMAHFFMFDLRDAGLTEVSRTGMASASGDTLYLPPHSFDLHMGRLLQYIYLNGLLPLFGFRSTAEMFGSWIDCREVADAIHSAISGVTDRLTRDQYEMYCMQGIEEAGEFVDERIGGYIDVATTMTISGSAIGTEPSTDGIAQRLENGMWTGSWDERGTGAEIEGSFTGVRRVR